MRFVRSIERKILLLGERENSDYSFMIMSHQRGQEGFSLPEVMVAVAIIAVTALGVSHLFTDGFNSTKKINQNSACTNHLNSVVNRIRSLGARLNIGDYLLPIPSPNRWAAVGMGTVNVEGDATGSDIDIVHRYPPNANFDIANVPVAGTPTELRNAHLIQGVIGGLLAIYNSNNATFCAAVGGGVYNVDPAGPAPVQLSDLFAPALGANQGLNNLQTTIRIRPFNLATGAIEACASPLIIAPRGNPRSMSDMMPTGLPAPLNVGQSNSGPRVWSAGACPANTVLIGPAPQGGNYCDSQGGISFAANVRNDVGLLVNLNANYVDNNNMAQGCSTEIRVQYPEDNGTPNTPMVRINRNSTWSNQVPTAPQGRMNEVPVGPTVPSGGAADVNCVPRNQNIVEIDVGFDGSAGSVNEPGTILLCRNRSYRLSPPESAPGSVPCFSPGPGPQFPPTAFFPIPGWLFNGTDGLPRPQHVVNSTLASTQFDVPYFNANGSPWAHIPDGDNTWRSCDQMTVCNGRSPNIATINVAPAPPNNPTQKWYRLRFDNLLSGCVIQLDVRAVDTAGNMSAIRTVDHTTTIAGNQIGVANVVEFPRCGRWCGGYYRCGTCP